MDYKLKGALISKFGSQTIAARELSISESRLSRILRGHVKPSAREREMLKRFLGHAKSEQLLDQAAI